MSAWRIVITTVLRCARGIWQYKKVWRRIKRDTNKEHTSQGIQSEGRTPRYDPEHNEAYCKYCYKTHRLWQRFWDVFPDEIVWECEVCNHRTRDEYMQIEGVKLSPEQKAFTIHRQSTSPDERPFS